MFLVFKYRNVDSLVDNPKFDPDTMDPNNLDSPDPKILKREQVLERVYVEDNERAVVRALGVIDEMDFYEIQHHGRGNVTLKYLEPPK